MTTTKTLHAHVSTESADCDGPMQRTYVTTMNSDEVGAGEFGDLDFKSRVLSNHVSFHGNTHVDTTKDGFHAVEQTDEGYRAASVEWCEDGTCRLDAYTQRDVFAEMAGY